MKIRLIALILVVILPAATPFTALWYHNNFHEHQHVLEKKWQKQIAEVKEQNKWNADHGIYPFILVDWSTSKTLHEIEVELDQCWMQDFFSVNHVSEVAMGIVLWFLAICFAFVSLINKAHEVEEGEDEVAIELLNDEPLFV